MNDPKDPGKERSTRKQHSDRQGSLLPEDPVLLLCSPNATAALQHLVLKVGNRRSFRTTSPNMQTATLQPSHQQKMHPTRVLPGRGVASYPLQHSPTNVPCLPHTQSGSLHTNQTNQLPFRNRRALQPKKLQRRYLHPLLLDFYRGLHGIVASARRSGQEDFPTRNSSSITSCSISPFPRACIITE